jgi:hypothetical protein
VLSARSTTAYVLWRLKFVDTDSDVVDANFLCWEPLLDYPTSHKLRDSGEKAVSCLQCLSAPPIAIVQSAPSGFADRWPRASRREISPEQHS